MRCWRRLQRQTMQARLAQRLTRDVLDLDLRVCKGLLELCLHGGLGRRVAHPLRCVQRALGGSQPKRRCCWSRLQG